MRVGELAGGETDRIGAFTALRFPPSALSRRFGKLNGGFPIHIRSHRIPTTRWLRPVGTTPIVVCRQKSPGAAVGKATGIASEEAAGNRRRTRFGDLDAVVLRFPDSRIGYRRVRAARFDHAAAAARPSVGNLDVIEDRFPAAGFELDVLPFTGSFIFDASEENWFASAAIGFESAFDDEFLFVKFHG